MLPQPQGRGLKPAGRADQKPGAFMRLKLLNRDPGGAPGLPADRDARAAGTGSSMMSGLAIRS